MAIVGIVLVVLTIIFIIAAVMIGLPQWEDAKAERIRAETQQIYANAAMVDAQARAIAAITSSVWPFFVLGLVVIVFFAVMYFRGNGQQAQTQVVFMLPEGTSRRALIDSAISMGYEVPHPNEMVIIPQGGNNDFASS